jgi:hypothetical protein
VLELLGWEEQEAEDYVVASKGGNCPEGAQVRRKHCPHAGGGGGGGGFPVL